MNQPMHQNLSENGKITMTEQELLSVLDMSEDEQWEWCVKNAKSAGESLADLAFRLRDELEMEQWPALAKAYECVRNKWCNDTWQQRHSMGLNKKHISSSLFWLFHAKPIHFIIAALIAKESK
jgi:hypothetical protein